MSPDGSDVPEEIRRILWPGESVVWHGRPGTRIILRLSDLPEVGIGLLIAYEMVVFFRDSNAASAPASLVLFGIGMSVVALGLVASPLLEARQRRHIRYVVTSERVVALAGNNSAAIRLAAVSRAAPSGTSVILETFGAGAEPVPHLDNLPNAGEVADIVRVARERFGKGAA